MADSRDARVRAARNRVIWVLEAACPSKCAYCDIESQQGRGALTVDEVAAAARDVIDAGFREVIFVGGEPLLSPAMPAALDVLAGRCEVALFTGGIPGFAARAVELVGRGVDRLVFSIDSARDGDNDLVRGRKGITRALIELVESVRAERPRVDLSFNTVVSRHNVESLPALWDRLRAFRPSSWSLTLVGDNFTADATPHLPSRAQIDRLYGETIPALALATQRDRIELVVLPVPFAFLVDRVPHAAWNVAAVTRDLDRFAAGDHNRSFVERCGCPLVGIDVSIGVQGEIYPCSQAPILQDRFVIGNVKSDRLDEVLHGRALEDFRSGVPHAPCVRCWAPSNVPRERLLEVVHASSRARAGAS
jgi:radical SAM protein with 4Fe4S-binding SPASM domain